MILTDNRQREAYTISKEYKKKVVNINITLDIRRRYIQQREDLRNTTVININGFKDKAKTQQLAGLTQRINKLTKHVINQRNRLFI